MNKIAVMFSCVVAGVALFSGLALLVSHHDVDELRPDIISDIIAQDTAREVLMFEVPTVASLPEAVTMHDLPEADRADLALYALRMELSRLGFPIDTNLDNVRQFVFMVQEAESNGDRYAKSTADAMSFYQFKPDSVITAVNRFENWTRRHEVGFPSWAHELRKHPESIYELQESLQAMLMMVNIIEQPGSDNELVQLIAGDVLAAKELYYAYHHTAPDDPTIELIERVFQAHFSL